MDVKVKEPAMWVVIVWKEAGLSISGMHSAVLLVLAMSKGLCDLEAAKASEARFLQLRAPVACWWKRWVSVLLRLAMAQRVS